MSKAELLRDLFAYNEWANNRLLNVAGKLDEGELKGAQGASFESILGNMVHILAAQIFWLERWKTLEADPASAEVPSVSTLAELIEAYAEWHSDLNRYIGRLAVDDFDGDLNLRDGDRARVSSLWQMMTHLANHGTFHRGEVAMALSALGHSPGDLDYLDFVELRAAGRA